MEGEVEKEVSLMVSLMEVEVSPMEGKVSFMEGGVKEIGPYSIPDFSKCTSRSKFSQHCISKWASQYLQ